MHVTILLSAVAMIGFAANSLLARAALATGATDAASFTAIRLLSGAVALVFFAWARGGRPALVARPGNWTSAMCLFGYAIFFSFAYLRLGTATGALILFAAVQGGMIGWGIVRRDRPTGLEVVGLVVAFAAFVYLLLPGLDSPDPIGSALMAAAGFAWAGYSVRGRGATDALGETAGNFVRAALVAVPFAFLPIAAGHVGALGAGLAVLSGVVASGLGYAIWYRALPRLSTAQGATVQLTVPVIAALGGVAFLGEALTVRLVIAGVAILGGVALAITARRPARR